MESKQDRIQRGIKKAKAQQMRRANDAQRQQSHAIDKKATVTVDLRTCIGYATHDNPQQVVDQFLRQQQSQQQ